MWWRGPKKKISDTEMKTKSFDFKGIVVFYFFVFSIGVLILRCAQDNELAEIDGIISIDSIAPAFGPVGTTVRIYGKGFSAITVTNKMSINGLNAPVIEPSSLRTIIIRVPDDATTGKVSLTIGSRHVEGPVFTVLDPPIIQSVTPLQGYAGYRVFVKGSKLAQITDILFNGVAGEIFSQTETDIVVVTPDSDTGAIEFLFKDGKVTGPVFTYLPIPVIDTAYVVRYSRVEDVIAIIGRYVSTDALSVQVYLNGEGSTIRDIVVDADGRAVILIAMPPREVDNPAILQIEADGVKSLPYQYTIPPIFYDISYQHIGNSLRVRLQAYGAYFGPPSNEKEVRVVNVGDPPTPVPTTVTNWTSTLVTVEFNVRIDQLYDINVVVNGAVSNTLQITP
jgi:hypothetical protein